MNCKWIFKIKYNVDGSMAKCKIHLVAKGFTQVESIDFNEPFFHVAWTESIRAVLVVVAIGVDVVLSGSFLVD
jgi:hypothetical protein